MGPLDAVALFLTKRPIKSCLLAFSGGGDSLCLFRVLLKLQPRFQFHLHLAHVDHGWRVENQEEARQAEHMARELNVPFHLARLSPQALTGNLESACRTARYDFFKEICLKESLEGVMVAHHRDDAAETILKRILEGASWSKLASLKEESSREGLSIWRPLLPVSRKKIDCFLEEQRLIPLQDPTNADTRFLRARIRHKLLPWLNETFGKRVENGLISIAEEAEEAAHYFQDRLHSCLQAVVRTPTGVFADWSLSLPESLFEIKYLLKLLCEKEGFFLSRSLVQQVANWLHSGALHRRCIMGTKQLLIHRKQLTISQL